MIPLFGVTVVVYLIRILCGSRNYKSYPILTNFNKNVFRGQIINNSLDFVLDFRFYHSSAFFYTCVFSLENETVIAHHDNGSIFIPYRFCSNLVKTYITPIEKVVRCGETCIRVSILHHFVSIEISLEPVEFNLRPHQF